MSADWQLPSVLRYSSMAISNGPRLLDDEKRSLPEWWNVVSSSVFIDCSVGTELALERSGIFLRWFITSEPRCKKRWSSSNKESLRYFSSRLSVSAPAAKEWYRLWYQRPRGRLKTLSLRYHWVESNSDHKDVNKKAQSEQRFCSIFWWRVVCSSESVGRVCYE